MRISLDESFAAITEHWSPVVIGELNGQQVKAVKFRGAFHWHQHTHEDEMFLVVPRGTEHRPVAEEEVEVILFEPATTVRTGD